ncbi:uncharacterized protein [Rutidosis leptorrhynchoides]|uniref:uncharacterized protein n=1 Tax=Rutidosis leptorrhynchoides TaxID=125765 RepID=UPI003A99E87E
MATLQKFKLLATQCAVAGSPTRSPSTSPVIHLRRRKTLRMLLSRGGGSSDGNRRLPVTDELVDLRGSDVDSSEDDEKDNGVRRKLKDLFVSSSASSPPIEEIRRDGGEDCDLIGRRGGGSGGFRGIRFLPGTLRQRLLRRAWKPVLVTIPE